MAAVTMDGTGLKIEKLNRENYHSWKFQIKMYLIGRDLWDIVQGIEELKSDATPDDRTKFRKREQLALSLICLSVNTDLHVYIRAVKTSKEAWDVLEKHFEGKSLSKKIMYRRKLYSARMKKGITMIDHINYVKTLAEHLEAVGDPVSDGDLVIILLSSLPEEFNNLVTALETIADEKLTWDYVRDRAINEFDKKHGEASNNKYNPEALFVNGYNKNKSKYNNYNGNRSNRGGSTGNRGGNHQSSSSGHNFRCHSCNEKGHFSRNCPKKNKEKKAAPEEGNLLEHGTYFDGFNPELALKAGDEEDNDITDWWIDSGASQHMTPIKSEIINYKKFSKPVEISLADNSSLYAYGAGYVQLRVFDEGIHNDILLEKVLYVPKMKKKLLSIPVVISKGVQVTFLNKNCIFTSKDKSYTVGHLHGKLYKLNTSPVETCCLVNSRNDNDAQLWHLRYGHLGYTSLLTLSNNEMVSGMKLMSKVPDSGPCEGCLMGKQNRHPFPKKSLSESSQPLDIIHSDVCGPMKVASIGGSRYFITFIDDYTKYFSVYMMKNKDEALQKFKDFSLLVENQFGSKIKKIRSDNGGEYINEEFDIYLKKCGISRNKTIPYTPQQNGVAERANRTLMELLRSMLYFAGLPKKFWAEALATAVYLKNRSPTSCFHGETPYQRWWKKKPEVGHLKVFGCTAYVHIPSEKRTKLDEKSLKCTFIGYSEESKGYKFFDPDKRRMFLSRDAVFDENKFVHKINDDKPVDEGMKSEGEKPLQKHEQLLPDILFMEDEKIEDENPDKGTPLNDEVVVRIEDNFVGEEEIDANDPDIPDDEFQNNRPIRQKKNPDRFGEWEYASIAVLEEPKTLSDALNGQYSKQWKKAVNAEYESLIKNETWDLVDLPDDKNLVGSKWVFKIKQNVDGEIDRFKARLVAQGYSQEPGIDFNEIYAPVARYNSIRSVLAIANQLDLHIHQMDVKSAFLNGTLSEDIYMKQPDGFVDKNNPEKVCKLKKSLYGLKQAARCWNVVMDEFLKSNGYIQSNADPCIYSKIVKRNSKDILILMAVYVDDTIIATSDIEILNGEKLKLCDKFEMDDRGEVHYLLGMRIKRNRMSRELSIDQTTYLEGVLKKFEMTECKPVSTPLEAGKKFVKLRDDEKSIDVTRYQAAIGSLTYASIGTRPDISAAVGVLSQFMSNPSSEHWTGVKRILRYLKGTLTFGLKFIASKNFSLVGYSDADWAGDINSRKSTSGYLFRIGDATVSWRSKKQAVIALSSTEAEYIALSSAAQEAIWLRRLLDSIHCTQKSGTVVFEDNQGAIALSSNPNNHPRTKHIDIKYHYTRELVQNGVIRLIYCPTNDMLADMFTKGLDRIKFEQMRLKIGVIDVL